MNTTAPDVNAPLSLNGSGKATSFLQQAAHITSGMYLQTPGSTDLVHYLIHSILPDPALRDEMLVAGQENVCVSL